MKPNMKRIIGTLAVASLICTTSCIKEEQRQAEGAADSTILTSKLIGDTSSEKEEGTLLVRLDPATVRLIEDGETPVLTKSVSGFISISPALKTRPRNEEVAAKYGLNEWYVIRFSEETPAEEVAAELAALPQVKRIQFNSYVRHISSDLSFECPETVLTKGSADGMTFNDPMLPKQWNLINTGDKSIAATAVEGADVGVKDAWRLTAGDPRVVVAVFDQGVRVTHTDLKDALWVNQKEKDGQPGVDDDNNGYRDDTNGYNFYEGKSRPSASYGADHGTHVAGTIAATNNNGVGVSSIAGGSGNGDGVRIMSCQIFENSANGGKTGDRTVADAFIYAADNGASIAQCSWCAPGGSFMTDSEYVNGIPSKKLEGSPLEYAALQYFLDPKNSKCEAVRGNVAVFAAGNESAAAAGYPSALPFCVCVTAFGPDFLPGGFSNRGPGCDIAAPGGDPWLTVPLTNEAPSMVLSTGVTNGDGAGYVYKYGTSMACPHVSGVVALGMSYALKLGKHFSREEFISKLLTSVNDIDQFMTEGKTKLYGEGSFNVSSYKGKMGTGAVDAWQFLMALEGTPYRLVKVGEKTSIDLSDYLNGTAANFDFTLFMDSTSKEELGIESDPVFKNGKLEITCSKVGLGKITLSSSVGKDNSREDGIGGLEFQRTIYIASRPFVSKNGGWF